MRVPLGVRLWNKGGYSKVELAGQLLREAERRGIYPEYMRRYFVTNDTQLSSGALKRHYRLRQQIEEVFRLLKQEFGWGGASAQKARAQLAHLHLGLYALCLTQEAAMQKMTGATSRPYPRPRWLLLLSMVRAMPSQPL